MGFLIGNGGVFWVFGLWGAPVALLVFGSGWLLSPQNFILFAPLWLTLYISLRKGDLT